MVTGTPKNVTAQSNIGTAIINIGLKLLLIIGFKHTGIFPCDKLVFLAADFLYSSVIDKRNST